MTCPRNYPLESMPAACRYHCPIRRGIRVNENWHSPASATAPGAPMHNKLSAQGIADRANKGYIARQRMERKRLDIPFHQQADRRIPECALIAFLLYRDSNDTRKVARKGIQELHQVQRLGIYKRGARRTQVIELLEQREKHRRQLDRGMILHAPLSDSEIAELAGVSRQCVGQHKQRLGYR